MGGLFSFINSGLLWWTGLVAAPILIYLINRQRYRRRRWAAMEFLLRALRKNQRRLQLQNLLLLIIRCLIILLLVLAASRPILRTTPLGLAAGDRQNWLLVIDTSYSMAYRSGDLSLFDQARDTLRRMVDDRTLGETIVRPGDSIALATLGYDPEVLLPRSEVTPDARRRVVDEIEGLRLTYRPARIAPSLRVIESLAEEFVGPAGDPEPVSIILFTDLQRRDWLVEDRPRDPEAVDILRRLVETHGAQIRVAALSGDERKLNIAVTDLSLRPELVARGLPVRLSVTVANLSDEDADHLDVTLRVAKASDIDPEGGEDGEAQLGEVVRIGAQDSITRPLYHRFDESGFYSVTAEVRSDGLVVDNRRHLVVPVKDDIGVLLIDGDPSVDPTERETFYLDFALRPVDDDLGAASGRYSPFLVETTTPDQLGSVDWRTYSVVILANVDDVSDDALAAIERFVSDGGALLVFLGDRVREAEYNELFHRGGEGLLPFALGGVRGSDQTPVYLRFGDESHPVARYFAEQKERSYLFGGGVVSFYRYWKFVERASESGAPLARVLCRFGDLDGSPAVIDNSYGRGRVMWFASSADRAWNELPVWQDYVVFLYESISYLLGFGSRTYNLGVGDIFSSVYESDEFASEVMLGLPPGDDADLGSRTLRKSMREIESERRFLVTHEDTSRPGLYRLDLLRPNSERGSTVECFAVNPDPAEGDLRPMEAADFTDQFAIAVESFDASERFRDLARQSELLRGREFWKTCLTAVLVLLLLETALAQLFGRRA